MELMFKSLWNMTEVQAMDLGNTWSRWMGKWTRELKNKHVFNYGIFRNEKQNMCWTVFSVVSRTV